MQTRQSGLYLSNTVDYAWLAPFVEPSRFGRDFGAKPMRDHQDLFDLIGLVLSEGDDDAVRALMKAISEQSAPIDIRLSTAAMHPNPCPDSGD